MTNKHIGSITKYYKNETPDLARYGLKRIAIHRREVLRSREIIREDGNKRPVSVLKKEHAVRQAEAKANKQSTSDQGKNQKIEV